MALEPGSVKRIVVAGCGGHARVVLDVIEKQKRYWVAGFLDESISAGALLYGLQVLGDENDLKRHVIEREIQGGIVAIGDNWTRSLVAAKIEKAIPGLVFVAAVHPSAQIGGDVSIGRGTVIMAGAVVNPGCRIGDFCIVNTNASLDHDSVMEDFSSLGPGVTTGGNVRIGTFSSVAIGATIVHGRTIGEHSVIGAGATVVRDIPASVVAYGVPARMIRRRKPDEKCL